MGSALVARRSEMRLAGAPHLPARLSRLWRLAHLPLETRKYIPTIGTASPTLCALLPSLKNRLPGLTFR